MKVELAKDKVGVLQVLIDGVNYGVFDDSVGERFSFFPRRTEQLTGDHFIAIGKELNKLNNKKQIK